MKQRKKEFYYFLLTAVKPTCAGFQWLTLITSIWCVFEAVQRTSLIYLLFALWFAMITLQFYFIQMNFTQEMINRFEAAKRRWQSVRLTRRQRRKLARLKAKQKH